MPLDAAASPQRAALSTLNTHEGLQNHDLPSSECNAKQINAPADSLVWRDTPPS